VIIETLKYINYYSIIQYWDDIVNLNSDLKFKILHSLRNSYRGRIPQQLYIQYRLSQFSAIIPNNNHYHNIHTQFVNKVSQFNLEIIIIMLQWLINYLWIKTIFFIKRIIIKGTNSHHNHNNYKIKIIQIVNHKLIINKIS